MSEEKKIVTIIDRPNSVEIKMSAKGEATFNVKTYGKTTKEAAEEAKKIFAELKIEYDKV